jgi:hypothetical protein
LLGAAAAWIALLDLPPNAVAARAAGCGAGAALGALAGAALALAAGLSRAARVAGAALAGLIYRVDQRIAMPEPVPLISSLRLTVAGWRNGGLPLPGVPGLLRRLAAAAARRALPAVLARIEALERGVESAQRIREALAGFIEARVRAAAAGPVLALRLAAAGCAAALAVVLLLLHGAAGR